MAGKPLVFKMGGSWVWQCHAHEDRRFGEDFPAEAWRNPWDVCLGGASRHAQQHHAEVEVIDQ